MCEACRVHWQIAALRSEGTSQAAESLSRASAEVRQTDPDTGGQKGSKPEEFAYIPVEPLEEVSRVYAYGAKKYAPGNFLKGYSWNLSISALFRHILAFLRGESKDPESGYHHLAHAAFHLFALMEFENKGLGKDDRLYKRDNKV